jgi:hypothetical protein
MSGSESHSEGFLCLRASPCIERGFQAVLGPFEAF